MHPKDADSMAVSWLHFGNALVGSEWATAILCMNRAVLLPCMAPISDGEALSQSGQVWLLAECRDYCQLVNGGCGLSHEHIEDGYKSTCVKLGEENPTELGIG